MGILCQLFQKWYIYLNCDSPTIIIKQRKIYKCMYAICDVLCVMSEDGCSKFNFLKVFILLPSAKQKYPKWISFMSFGGHQIDPCKALQIKIIPICTLKPFDIIL